MTSTLIRAACMELITPITFTRVSILGSSASSAAGTAFAASSVAATALVEFPLATGAPGSSLLATKLSSRRMASTFETLKSLQD